MSSKNWSSRWWVFNSKSYHLRGSFNYKLYDKVKSLRTNQLK